MNRIPYLAAILFILFCTDAVCLAQEKPNAVLADEFSADVNCDDMLAHIDYFARHLLADPHSEGIAVFYPKKQSPQAALLYEEQLVHGIDFRRFGENVPKIIIGKPRESTKMEFWVVPPGAERPKFIEADPGEIFAGVTKPFVYNTSFGGEVCPGINPKLYADLINSNPNVTGKIVVRNNSLSKARKIGNRWLRSLTVKYRIPRNKLKLAFANEQDRPDEEFWIVPKK